MTAYLSVCSGIEAATVAWHPLGWEPVGFSEIEAFPSAVLSHHYPNIPNLGDMERFDEWPESAIDVLVGGTPCQSFSVAGLRKGLDDPRGNLALGYLAIAERYRPCWIVWENVPGVLSSDEGRAMGSFLGGLAKLGYGYAWRVLDAQYFGLAQRRKRVFVVGYLGDWRPPAAVLLEPEGMRRDSAPCREAGENLAGTLRNRAPGSGGQGTDAEQVVARCLNGNERGFADPDTDTFIPEVAAAVTSGVPNGGAGHGARSGHAKYSTLIPTAVHHTLPATSCPPHLASPYAVRRLTPRECERLQGFPDDYTLIPYRGKPAEQCPDGPRYKALGNSMAVPVMHWIGRRIALMDKTKIELETC